MKSFCINTKITCAPEHCTQNMKDKQSAIYHEENTVLQRTGWMGQDREQSLLSALPDGHLHCC